jgi:hypothetical protein
LGGDILISSSLLNETANQPSAETSEYLTMKIISFSFALLLATTLSLKAGPADEKAFTEKYKTAFEAKDNATLTSLLYTKGSDPGAVEFYKMMMTSEAGGKISKIELTALTPEEAKKAGEPQDAPGGGKACMPIKPTKKLVIEVTTKDGDSSSTSSSTSFVAEQDGKLVIPVPGPCK